METHRLALPPGYRIESYEIVRMLGKGGFGITYQARDVQIGRLVAIKELLPDSIATRLAGSTVVPQSEGHEENWEWARERFIVAETLIKNLGGEHTHPACPARLPAGQLFSSPHPGQSRKRATAD